MLHYRFINQRGCWFKSHQCRVATVGQLNNTLTLHLLDNLLSQYYKFSLISICEFQSVSNSNTIAISTWFDVVVQFRFGSKIMTNQLLQELSYRLSHHCLDVQRAICSTVSLVLSTLLLISTAQKT